MDKMDNEGYGIHVDGGSGQRAADGACPGHATINTNRFTACGRSSLRQIPSSLPSELRCRPPKEWSSIPTVSLLSRRPHRFLTLTLLILLFCNPTGAAFIHFQNCLPENIQASTDPRILQFEPIRFWAAFDQTDEGYKLNVTTYGNITGVSVNTSYPSWNDPSWLNPNKSLGKIVDLSESNNKFSTLFATFNVLSYTQYAAPPSRFCESTVGQACPLIPAFNVSKTDITSLPGFTLSHTLNSSYAFTSIAANLRVASGDASIRDLACVKATITPDIGASLRSMMTYLPLVILLCVGAATITAAMFSPWGSMDLFHWTSNWGRDEDLLRLVTPGFAECLQYIQFIILTGSLTLRYPAYFRPVVSSVGWSVLMFNSSFVSHGNGTRSIQDGIYVVNTDDTYGLDQMSQLIGMKSVRDIWTGMIIWLLVILAAVVVLIQLGFFLRWAYRVITGVPQEDLRQKNWPFTAGNVIRIIFNYFFLPLVSLSMFQLATAIKGPIVAIVLAVLVLVGIVGFTGWLIYMIASIRPRSFLFDDLSTFLTYGPLYNTYSDEAASYVVIQIFVNILRGIAIGAVQASGIAQLVLLAICEIILGLTLIAIRPYPAPTSMNLYHTCLAAWRAITIFLCVAFVPSLGVADAPRGWIGYIILLLHALGLVFGFFLNALQTVVEVVARRAGAGDHGGGATRGGLSKVFGMRQLQRRVSRRGNGSRHSMTSGVGMLSPELDQKTGAHVDHGRPRSTSASSTFLLQQRAGGGSDGRSSLQDSTGATNWQHRARNSGQFTPNTLEADSTISRTASGNRLSSLPSGAVALKQVDGADPYYRPPRQRRDTIDLISSPARNRRSMSSGDLLQDTPTGTERPRSDETAGPGPSVFGQVSPGQTRKMGDREEDDEDVNDQTNGTTSDYYASREVDFYYGIRGPALSSGTRRLKTGPADPTGTVSSARGWVKNFFGGPAKEKSKGFEVVRGARAPPQNMLRDLNAGGVPEPPYRQDQANNLDAEQRRDASIDGDGEHLEISRKRAQSGSHVNEQDDLRIDSDVTTTPPLLPAMDMGGGIELPDRTSAHTQPESGEAAADSTQPPYVPRKSSKRISQAAAANFPATHLPAVTPTSSVGPSPPTSLASPSKRQSFGHKHTMSSTSGRLPFGMGNPPSRGSRYSTGMESTTSSMGGIGNEENFVVPFGHARHSSSALGTHLPDIADDRPSSIGLVPQHRASDNIRKAETDSPRFEGSTAEFVGSPVSRGYG